MDFERYLERIGFTGEDRTPSYATLQRLQNAHMLTVPFENIEVFEAGRRKFLYLEQLYQKIVVNKRGGWCHELNGLFAALLTHLGFTCHLASSRHCKGNAGDFTDKEFDHMIIIVDLGGKSYLTDVGWGSPVLHFDPLEIKLDVEFPISNGIYKIIRDTTKENFILQLKRVEKAGEVEEVGKRPEDGKKRPDWITIHTFNTMPRNLADFQERCDEYQFVKESSILARTPLAVIRFNKGKGTYLLLGKSLIQQEIRENVLFKEPLIVDMEDPVMLDQLKEKFGMEIDPNSFSWDRDAPVYF